MSEAAEDAGRWLGLLGFILLSILLATRFVALTWTVDGPSMLPTLAPGDRLIVDRWSYSVRAPRAGEIALIRGPDGLALVKRVSAADAEAPRDRPAGTGAWRVLGDNPRESQDSREFGAVPAGRFVGRVVGRYWPLAGFGPLDGPATLPER